MRLRKVEKTGKSKLLGVNELKDYLSLGRASAEKVGKAAEANIKIGRRVLYDREKIDSYINSLSERRAAI